jgi:ACS family glucarate transporter-like MFS transporter
MNRDLSTVAPPGLLRPTRVRYGVLGFACALSMITYLDRVCFGTVAPYIQTEFQLTNDQLGLLFTAFALAYAVFEVPTGWLGDMFGARRTLIRIVLWWSAFTALTGAIYPTPATPLLAFAGLLAVRFFFGVGEAGAYPNISHAFASWFPFGERGSAQGAVWMAGRFMGGLSPLAVLALVYTVATPNGELVTHWRHIFWIFGGIGVCWCVLFYFWFRDRPEEHPAVNTAELALIRGLPPASVSLDFSGAVQPAGTEAVLPAEQAHGAQTAPSVPTLAPPHSPSAGSQDEHSHANVPWGKLLTDINLWALCLMYFGAAYGWYFNITWLPKYLGAAYGVKPETHGFWTTSLLAGAPLLLGSLACLVGGLLTDGFIRATGNRKWGRRLFGVVGHGACALCYFLSLTAGSPYLFVLFIALAAFCNDLTMGSAWASCIDIGGRYSGIVSGCMNTIGNLGGALAGSLTGVILARFGDQTGWAINFATYGGVYVAAMLMWLCFDSTRPAGQVGALWEMVGILLLGLVLAVVTVSVADLDLLYQQCVRWLTGFGLPVWVARMCSFLIQFVCGLPLVGIPWVLVRTLWLGARRATSGAAG